MLSHPKPSHLKGALPIKWLVAFCALHSVVAADESFLFMPSPAVASRQKDTPIDMPGLVDAPGSDNFVAFKPLPSR